jgi:NAD(P)-dependent dehydrogenase (short-subunit alcohol dehydrogenase family)
MEKLSGKTALVTGSTDGVGRLVARKLGQAGARVLAHGRDAERGTRVVAEIEASSGAATFLAADLSALAEVRRLADEAQATVEVRVRPVPSGFELRFAVNYQEVVPLDDDFAEIGDLGGSPRWLGYRRPLLHELTPYFPSRKR